MITKVQYDDAIKIVHKYLLQSQIDVPSEKTTHWIKKYVNLIGIQKEDNLNTIASVRLLNVLFSYRIKLGISCDIFEFHDIKIKELSNISLKVFSECRNAGTTTIEELKAICYYAQINLK